ncbi:hypothetical protein CS022_06835 [Veronia nyctiphanis]|uniref:PLD phosphodiesterase domain-containing protein n=1 Tax=Veronia nyctiphanis TaxID=1278244 RepID=A0A4Q0YS25_9GAMM|nr:phospholipase D-like domain-containing protein [Veronia nyctiphanis]RXJ73982.1 hypothetical protein CS022_06835 [Veronia nyctiphanis]
MLKQSLQLITIALTMGLYGCAAIKTPEKEFQQILDEHAIPLAISSGQIVQGNDAALQSKLALINRAQNTIDMAYYIFADDPSTAVITDALLKATKRGVKVRILLDYFVNYRHFARLSRLESITEQHAGSLTFHLFNAPDQQIILDAIYMTLGCGEAGPGTKTQRLSCSEEKLNTIETLIQSKADKASTYGSRLLLAGLYGRSAPLMQMALMSSIDNALEELSRLNVQQGGGASPEQIKRIGRIYFEAKFSGGLNKLVNQIQLSSLSLLYGDQLEPYFSALSDFLPVSRKRSGKDSLPWRHMTDFLHHKLLLVDSEAFQLGGRNLEDAYHTQPYSSSGKYTFIDTDVMVTLSNKSAGMKQRFDTLWHFTPMVASLDEVRQQTDTQALIAYQQAESVCDTDSCIRDIFEQKLTVSSDMLAADLDNRRAEMLARYEQYKQAHLRPVQQKISLSEKARLYYLENIPFSPTNKDSRQFGAKHGKESESGKHIHQLWLTAIDKVCDDAVKGEAVTLSYTMLT